MTLRLYATRLRPHAFALLAATIGLWVAADNYLGRPVATLGPDIDQAWWMARQLFQGRDPYSVDQALHLFLTRVYYPLTAAIIAAPLALLPIDVARVVFVCGSAALFGYAIGRERPYLWPTLFGVPFLYAMRAAQWSPLMTTAKLWPSLGWLAAVKPNLGVVMLAAVRSKRGALILVGGGAVVLAVSLVVQPMWPFAWRGALATSTHFKPLILRPAGFLVLLALVRWRDPDARLVLAMGLVPVTGTPYDALPLCLVAQTRVQAALLALATYLPAVAATPFGPTTTLVEMKRVQSTHLLWSALIPALALVLWRGLPACRERASMVRARLLSGSGHES